jgi:hypothetical protein
MWFLCGSEIQIAISTGPNFKKWSIWRNGEKMYILIEPKLYMNGPVWIGQVGHHYGTNLTFCKILKNYYLNCWLQTWLKSSLDGPIPNIYVICVNWQYLKYIGCVMVSVIDRWFELWPGQTKDYKKYKYLLLLRSARSIKEKEQRLVGSECVRVGQHVYQQTVVSVS